MSVAAYGELVEEVERAAAGKTAVAGSGTPDPAGALARAGVGLR